MIAAAASLGGAITALNYGHVGPGDGHWSQSGEFIFIALMAPATGRCVRRPTVFELVRTYVAGVGANAGA